MNPQKNPEVYYISMESLVFPDIFLFIPESRFPPSFICLCHPSAVLFNSVLSGKSPMCESMVRKWESDGTEDRRGSTEDANKEIPISSDNFTDMCYLHFTSRTKKQKKNPIQSSVSHVFLEELFYLKTGKWTAFPIWMINLLVCYPHIHISQTSFYFFFFFFAFKCWQSQKTLNWKRFSLPFVMLSVLSPLATKS